MKTAKISIYPLIKSPKKLFHQLEALVNPSCQPLSLDKFLSEGKPFMSGLRSSPCFWELKGPSGACIFLHKPYPSNKGEAEREDKWPLLRNNGELLVRENFPSSVCRNIHREIKTTSGRECGSRGQVQHWCLLWHPRVKILLNYLSQELKMQLSEGSHVS